MSRGPSASCLRTAGRERLRARHPGCHATLGREAHSRRAAWRWPLGHLLTSVLLGLRACLGVCSARAQSRRLPTVCEWTGGWLAPGSLAAVARRGSCAEKEPAAYSECVSAGGGCPRIWVVRATGDVGAARAEGDGPGRKGLPALARAGEMGFTGQFLQSNGLGHLNPLELLDCRRRL